MRREVEPIVCGRRAIADEHWKTVLVAQLVVIVVLGKKSTFSYEIGLG
jgi:hypothetical protein